MVTEEARIKYPDHADPKREFDYRVPVEVFKEWLTDSETLDFFNIDYAKFTDQMVMAVVEFDKDRSIRILVPKSVFTDVK